MSDQHLLSDYRDRDDRDAFERIVARHGPMVLRVCRDVLGDRHAAEDAFQATFLVLARGAGGVRDPERLGRWLYGVARRVAVRACVRARRLRARTAAGVAVEEIAMAGVAADPGRDEVRPLLHDEVDRLPPKLRSAILLCYFEDLTHEQAAGRLGVPLGTLKGRLRAGRAALGVRLRRRGAAVTAVLLLMLLLEGSPAVSPTLAGEVSRRARDEAASRATLPEIARLASSRAATSRPIRSVPLLALLVALAVGSAVAGAAWGLAPSSQVVASPPAGAGPAPPAPGVLQPMRRCD